MRYVIIGILPNLTRLFTQADDLTEAKRKRRDYAMIYIDIEIQIIDRVECTAVS